MALGSASSEITHETGGSICYGCWVLHFVISPTKERGWRFVTEMGSASGDHAPARGYDLLRALGSASGEITHGRRGTCCYGALCSASCDLAYETAGLRFVTGIGFCDWWYHARDRGEICYGHWAFVLWYHTRERCTTCYEHWVLRSVISHTGQGVRLVTDIGFCVLWYHTRNRECDLSHTRQEVRFVTGLVFCILRYHIRN